MKQNGYGDKITIIHGMIEEVEVPEEVSSVKLFSDSEKASNDYFHGIFCLLSDILSYEINLLVNNFEN